MRITLTGEQNRVFSLPIQNPVQIKGVAGSGKTTVAVYRARHLALSFNELFRKSKAHIFSYNRSLTHFIKGLLAEEQGPPCVSVSTVHSWAWGYLRGNGFWKKYQVVKNDEAQAILTRILAAMRQRYPESNILSKSLEFHVQEIKWMKGRRILTKQLYLDNKRTGRGRQDRVTAADKELLWEVFERYCSALNQRALVEYDDFANIALCSIDKNPDFTPPFSHIVVDEAQDLSLAQLQLITKLVSAETNSITLVADAAQKIYKSGFSWSDVGLNMRGRPVFEFKQNYRNTLQIADLAVSLLAHDPQPGEFSEHLLPQREGTLPEVALSVTAARQLALLTERLQGVDLSAESFVVLHRTNYGVDNLCSALTQAGFTPLKISDGSSAELQVPGLYLCTMSSIKGLECDHVALCDLNENILPYAKGFAEEEDEQHIITERRLLYTCMTRARKTLLMFSTGVPSRYLAELDSSKFRRLV